MDELDYLLSGATAKASPSRNVLGDITNRVESNSRLPTMRSHLGELLHLLDGSPAKAAPNRNVLGDITNRVELNSGLPTMGSRSGFENGTLD